MVETVNSSTAVGYALTESSTQKTTDQTATSEAPKTSGTLAEDSVTLSDEARAAALGDPDWPKPPTEED